MRLRMGAFLLAAALAGCDEPIASETGPPGLEKPRVPAFDPGEGAQALGEQAPKFVRQDKVANPDASSPPTPIGQGRKTASGLAYETLKEGTGAVARSGQTVTIEYTGKLADGKVFDTSRGKKPFTTKLGVGSVIKGWDEGVPGMKVGEQRKLTIPPELGYGANGSAPDIPPNATLIFDVELMDVK